MFTEKEVTVVATVPSLEGSLYLTDPQSIIAYTLRKYFRTPKDAVPMFEDLIISLPWQEANFGREPDTLVRNIQSDLQGAFDRIFKGERDVTVSVSHSDVSSSMSYTVTLSVIYSLLNGEISQSGTTISLVNGRLVIPEDKIDFLRS